MVKENDSKYFLIAKGEGGGGGYSTEFGESEIPAGVIIIL